MKNKYQYLMFILLIGCNHSNKVTSEEISSCEQLKYGLLWNIDINSTEWRNEYMDYISTCLNDSATTKKIATLDANQGNYTFIVYGMMSSSAIDGFENIYENYPIGFYSPGCDENNYGILYNEELQKLLLKNENLDLDEILEEEFNRED